MHHVCVAHASTPNQFCIVIISCHPKWLHASRALRLDVALKSSNLFFGNLPECLFFHFLFKRCISLWYAFEYNNLCSEDLGALLAGLLLIPPGGPFEPPPPEPSVFELGFLRTRLETVFSQCKIGIAVARVCVFPWIWKKAVIIPVRQSLAVPTDLYSSPLYTVINCSSRPSQYTAGISSSDGKKVSALMSPIARMLGC